MVTGINNAGVDETDLMKFADFKTTVLANVKSKTAQKILAYFQEQNLKDDDYVDLNKINLNQDEEISKDEWNALGIHISSREATELDKALQAQRSADHKKAVEEMNKMKAEAGKTLLQSEVEKFEDGTFIEKFYDSDGNLVKTSRLIVDGVLDGFTLETEYNSAGKVIRERRLCPDGIILCHSQDIYEYDESGKLVKKVLSLDYSHCDTETYEYTEHDENGNPLKAIITTDIKYKGKGKGGPFVEKYEYDENGNITKTTREDMDGRIHYITRYEYDKNNNITKRTDMKNDGRVIVEETYEYDDDGHMLRITASDGYEETFYSNGQTKTRNNFNLKSTFYSDHYATMYDPQGNKIVDISEKYISKGNSRLEKTTYEYDSNGNLIDQKTEPFTGTVDEDGNIIDDDTP